jgi:hypothetical protein
LAQLSVVPPNDVERPAETIAHLDQSQCGVMPDELIQTPLDLLQALKRLHTRQMKRRTPFQGQTCGKKSIGTLTIEQVTVGYWAWPKPHLCIPTEKALFCGQVHRMRLS